MNIPCQMALQGNSMYIPDGLNFVVRVLTTEFGTDVPTVAPTAGVPTKPVSQPTTAKPTATLKPTSEPSLKPISSPTFIPSIAPTTAPGIEFDATFAFNNVTVTPLDVKCTDAIVAAVAETLDLPADQVEVASQRPRGLRRARQLTAQGFYSVEVVVHIIAFVTDFPNMSDTTINGTALFHALKDTLDAAVDSGDFHDTLLDVATTSGADGLTHISNDLTVETTTFEVITSDDTITTADRDNNSKNRALSGGAIAGIVIGGLVLLLLCCIAVYLVVGRGKGGNKVAAANG